MMKAIWSVSGMILATAFSVADIHAADTGTAEEATALVKKAVDYAKKNGKEKAIAEFNNPKSQFIDRDLYIFAYDRNGVNLAIPTNPRMVGKNLMDLRDADGKYVMKAMLDTINTKGSGWVNYRWVNPVTKDIEKKSSYVEKVDDFFVGCGIYEK